MNLIKLIIQAKQNKKAWLRILEAFIAVMLIAGFLLVVSTRIGQKDTGEIQKIQLSILSEISQDSELRNYVLSKSKEDKQKLNIFIETRMPASLNFTARICNIEEVCGMPFYVNKDVYADSIIVSSTLQQYNPKKLKLFIWEK